MTGFNRALILFALLLSTASALDEELHEDTTNRTARYQRFGAQAARNALTQNSCVASSGYSGTCMTRFKCLRNGGTLSGFCGTYGVCCETNMQCSGISSLKRTLIQTPSTLPTRCVYTFEPYSLKVCQLKIEMEVFRLQQPQQVTTGVNTGDTIVCLDQLVVNGMTFCGNNDGQHIFVPFDVSGGTDANVNLVFSLPTRDAVARWRLIVTQLECPTATVRKGILPFAKNAGLQDFKNVFSSSNNDLPLLAPQGCTQYFTERTGTFESFNYNEGVGPYLASMFYAICFYRQPGDSAIEFTLTTFKLPNEGVNLGHDADCHSLIPTPGKQDDYLLIPGAVQVSSAVTLQPTYFCGTSNEGSKVIYGAPGPFVIYFNSDQYASSEDVGFKISYTIV